MKKFVFAEKVVSALDVAIACDKNLILYGRGGHGKSEMVAQYFAETGTPVFTQVFGEGMTEERLLGGIDLPLFNKTGKVQYLPENSWMAHEYVIFEEMFDAPTNVLLTLKDILTSKVLRNGAQTFEIKTRCIIALTNRTAEEVGVDLSSKALLERFPLRLEVRWEKYGVEEYKTLLDTVFGETPTTHQNELLARICAKTVERGGFVSPRTAVHAAEVLAECGEEALQFIEDIPYDIVKETIAEIEAIKLLAAQRSQFRKMKSEVSKLVEALTKSTDQAALLDILKKLKVVRGELSASPVSSEMQNDWQELRLSCDRAINSIIDKI